MMRSRASAPAAPRASPVLFSPPPAHFPSKPKIPPSQPWTDHRDDACDVPPTPRRQAHTTRPTPSLGHYGVSPHYSGVRPDDSGVPQNRHRNCRNRSNRPSKRFPPALRDTTAHTRARNTRSLGRTAIRSSWRSPSPRFSDSRKSSGPFRQAGQAAPSQRPLQHLPP
jgi:hypothetical protein